MSQLDPESRLLLQQALPALSPSDAARVRARARLQALGTPPSNTPSRSDETSAPDGSSTRVSLPRRHYGAALLSLGLVIGGIGGFVLGTHVASRTEEEHVEATKPHRAALAMEGPLPAVGDSETADSIGMVPKAPASSASIATHDVPLKRLHEGIGARLRGKTQREVTTHKREEDEVMWVQRVRKALARNEAQLALALLRELDIEVPSGRLGEERAAGRAIAYCMIGQATSKHEAEAFAARYPNSVHLSRVKLVCGPWLRNGDETK